MIFGLYDLDFWVLPKMLTHTTAASLPEIRVEMQRLYPNFTNNFFLIKKIQKNAKIKKYISCRMLLKTQKLMNN